MPSTLRRSLTALLVVLFLGPTTAMAGDESVDPVALTIVEQSPTVAPGGQFVVRLAPSALSDLDLMVDVEVHAPLTDPLATVGAGDGAWADPLPSIGGTGLAEVLVSTQGGLTVRMAIGPPGGGTGNADANTDADNDADAGLLTLPGPGVYPVRLTLADGDGVQGRVTTLLVHRAGPGAAGPLRQPVAVVVEIGDVGLEPAQAVPVLAALGDRPALTVLHRDAVGALERDGDGTEALVGALGGRPVVIGTTTPLDPSALAATDQGHAWADGLARMRARVERLGFTTDPSAAILEAPLTEAGADLVAGAGVRTVVGHRVPGSASPELWPPVSGSVTTPAGSVLGVVGGDRTRLSGQVAAAAQGASQAHLLLAQLSAPALTVEQPSADPDTGDSASDTGAPGLHWVAGLDRFDDPVSTVALLGRPEARALVRAEPLDGARVSELLSGRSSPDPGPPVASDQPSGPEEGESIPGSGPAAGAGPVALRRTPAQDLTGSAEAVAGIETLLARYAQFHGGGARPPDHFRNVLLQAYRTDVTPETRDTTLARVEAELRDAFGAVGLPGNQPVTLAARSGPIPVAVTNSADGPRRVRVAVTSDRIELAEPDLLLTLEPGAGVVDVPVHTRSLGASPVTVDLLSPDGAEVLATTRFQVRSTAVPGLGLLLAGGGLAALAFWWAVSLRRGRPDDDTTGPTGPGGDPAGRAANADPAPGRVPGPVDGPAPGQGPGHDPGHDLRDQSAHDPDRGPGHDPGHDLRDRPDHDPGHDLRDQSAHDPDRGPGHDPGHEAEGGRTGDGGPRERGRSGEATDGRRDRPGTGRPGPMEVTVPGASAPPSSGRAASVGTRSRSGDGRLPPPARVDAGGSV